MKKRKLDLFISAALSIAVAFTMAPTVTFAVEGDDPGADFDVPSEVITEETLQDEEMDAGEPAAEEPAEEEPVAEEDDAVVQAASANESNDVVSAGENTGELVNIAGYDKKMRIYGIYLHRANGTRKSSDRYGDAVLIESNGKYLLMDTGEDCPIKGDDSTVIQSSLVSTLKSIGVKELDVYISHLHSDHTGGLKDVCNNFKVNRLYLPDLKLCENYHTPGGYSIESRYAYNINKATGKVNEIIFLKPSFKAHKDIVYNGVEYCPGARTTDMFSVGGATFSVIGPVGTYTVDQFKKQDGDCGTKEGHCLNNCSLVTIVQCGSFRYMTAGDIEKQEEAALVNKYGYGLNCNMMKASHHGLRTSTTQSFLDRVTPKWSFNEDHGFSGSTYAQVKRMKNKGYNFSVLDNRCNFIADINNGAARIYPDANNNGRIDEKPLTGWVKVTGSKTRYQYYNASGVITWRWAWLNKSLYYFDINSGFRLTGKAVINGKKVEFDKDGKLISHKKPKKAVIKSVQAKKKHKIKVTWAKAKRASAYQVYRKTGKHGTYIYIGTYGKKARSMKDKKGVARGNTYYYKVRAIRYVAGGTMYGAFSKAQKVKAR